MRDEGPSVNLKWAVAAAAFLLLISLALVVGASKEPPQPGSSYDASGRGLLASYLLLDELGYPVARSRQVRGGDVRWLLFPQRSPRQVRELAALHHGVAWSGRPVGDVEGMPQPMDEEHDHKHQQHRAEPQQQPECEGRVGVQGAQPVEDGPE